MPALQHQYSVADDPQLEAQVEKGVQDVMNTIYFWKQAVQLHVDFIVQQYRNHLAKQHSLQQCQYEKDNDYYVSQDFEAEEQVKAEADDDFWSDFSDGDYQVDVE